MEKKNSKICLFILTEFTNVTDRHTDTQTPHDDIGRACIASRGKYHPILVKLFYTTSFHHKHSSRKTRKILNHWRRFFLERVGGVDGGEIETPKASRGRGMGRECPPPQPTRGLGERRKLPQRGPGQSPGRKRVLVHSELERTHVVTINLVFLAGGRPILEGGGILHNVIPHIFSREMHPPSPRIYAHVLNSTLCFKKKFTLRTFMITVWNENQCN